jgi:hypothetical protein
MIRRRPPDQERAIKYGPVLALTPTKAFSRDSDSIASGD